LDCHGRRGRRIQARFRGRQSGHAQPGPRFFSIRPCRIHGAVSWAPRQRKHRPARFRRPFGRGPPASFVSSRKASSYSELNGLGDVKTTVEPRRLCRIFIRSTGSARAAAKLRQGIGGHHGVVADLSADVIVPVIQRLILSAGPALPPGRAPKRPRPILVSMPCRRWRRGLPAFDAKGGAPRRSAAGGSGVLSNQSAMGSSPPMSEYERLLGDAAKSPLVTLRGSRKPNHGRYRPPPTRSTSRYDRDAMYRSSRCVSFATILLVARQRRRPARCLKTGQTKLQAIKKPSASSRRSAAR